ncbi:MAG: peptidoglycan DD-metalloendopeptidase family protein [Pseudomonadota bacterium]
MPITTRLPLTALLLGGLLWYGCAHAGYQGPEESRVPGGVALIDLGEADQRPAASLNGDAVWVRRNGDGWEAVVGIPLETEPGELAIETDSGERHTFTVEPKEYRTQHLDIADRSKVNPSQEQLERIWSEHSAINTAYSRWRDEAEPTSMVFEPPVEGPRSSSFGLRRILNGEPRSPHSGMDIAAPTGTPIQSPAPGQVTATGDYFFNGRTVFIDHGRGVVTMYCHMDEIDVEPGQRVETGDIIGTVGATGRVTGAHLHWSVSLNNARVDPALFLPTTQE